MKRTDLDLGYILNLSNFEKIQDTMAAATEMAMVTVDYQGNRITRHSRCSAFCEHVRASAAYGPICEKCDAHGGLEAARLGRPFIYLCHMGVVDFATPIIVHGQYIGAIMAGQVRLIEDGGHHGEGECLDQIMPAKRQPGMMQTDSEMAAYYQQLPQMTLAHVRANADMMFQISHYIVEEALLKIHLIDQIDDLQPPAVKIPAQVVDLVAIPDVNNIILQPALAFIQKNYHQSIGLDEMAALCNISASYFSKLFNKVVGENLAYYVNRIRITKARQLLETSDTSILNLAMDIGFDDSGYFIKVFKKLTGETPTAYRSLHRRQARP